MRYPGLKKYCDFVGFGLVLWLILAAGCTHGRIERVAPVVDPAQAAIDQAEQLFQTGNLDLASKYFYSYLYQYPRGSNVGFALLRLGDISLRQNDPFAAQAYYQRLVDEYPKSPWVDQAFGQLIALTVTNQEPDAALAAAVNLEHYDLSPSVRRTLWQQLLRIYRGKENAVETARYTYLLYSSSGPGEKDQWLHQLTTAINRLELSDIDRLWMTMTDDAIRSYLMFRCAMLNVMAGNDEDALDLLSAFCRLYPDHPLWAEASQFVTSLTQNLSFAPYTLGCLLPLSGPYQALGERALSGIEMAISRLPHGETAPPVKIIVKDTQSQDHMAIQGVRELAQARVAAIIGPITTAAAAAQEAQSLGVPIVTFTQKLHIAAIGNCVFQHFITPNNQIDTLTNYLAHDLGLRRFAIMYPDDSYGQTFMDLFWDAVLRKGGTITGVEAYNTKLTDFANPIQKLVGTYYSIPKDLRTPPVVFTEKDPYFSYRLETRNPLETLFPDPLIRLSGLYSQDYHSERNEGSGTSMDREEKHKRRPNIDFDALFIPDEPKNVGLILPQLAFFDIKDVYLVGTNLWHSNQLIDMTNSFSDNAIMVDGFFKEGRAAAVKGFVDGYRRLYDKDPGIIEAFAFDTANVLFSLLERPQLHLLPQMRQALQQSVTGQGATGPLYFADDGEAVKWLTLLRLRGGRFAEIDRP